MKGYLYRLRNNYSLEFPRIPALFENSSAGLENRWPEISDPFRSKVALITGASSGIGRSIAMEMASRGVKVMLASRTEENLLAVKNEIEEMGGIASLFVVDVTDEKRCQELVKATIRVFQRIDFLINNAGISMRANFSEVDMGVLRKVMETNFWGSVYCSRYALPHIIETRGSIVGISSICGVTPLPGRSGYSASKHALDGFLESLRLENLENGLHIMLVHPGYTASNIRQVSLDKNGEPHLESHLDEQKLMSSERVAREVVAGIASRRRDVVLTFEGKIITWIYKRRPRIAERLLHREKIIKVS
ncbi:MAG: SDR family oxidoreductase [Bacteroidales bacterium]